MKSSFLTARDARQTKEWGVFLTSLGWKSEVVDGVQVFIRTIPFLKRSFIKIQHPVGSLSITKIDRLAKKRNALFVVIEPHPSGYTEESFRKHGYRISKLRFAHSATILINLRKSLQELRESFSQNARRNIKKAEKQLEVKIIPLKNEKDEERIREFYQYYTQLGIRKKFYVPPYKEVHAKVMAFKKTSYFIYAYEKTHVISKEERLRPYEVDSPLVGRNPMGSLTSARDDKKRNKQDAVAVLWVGYFDDVLVYFHPGNTERGYALLANYLLVWEALKLGKKLGLSVFDFETSYDERYPKENERWKGYTAFKKKFGGEEVLYPPSYIRFYNPVFKLFYSFMTMFAK
jgi:lipid II:glycine glycyltransferase (peptidoglycan interpeptide bridge formation enzyme)